MNKKVIIFSVVGALLVIAASVGASLFLNGMLHGGAAKADAHAEPEKPKAPPAYKSIEPAFVVNIDDAGMMRFLQIQVELMAHDPVLIEGIDKVLPRIRGDLLMLFSAVQMDTVRSPEGREKLRRQALEVVNKALVDETGKGGVEAIYFTRLVIQ